MLNSEQNDEVCDATDDDSSTEAGNKKIQRTEKRTNKILRL
jgi:hypothetical protein